MGSMNRAARPSPRSPTSSTVSVSSAAVSYRDVDIPKDAAFLTELMNERIRNSPFYGFFEENTVEERTAWLQVLVENRYPVIIAEIAGEQVGFMCARPFSIKSGYAFTAEISVYLVARARRRKIGKNLWQRLLDHPLTKQRRLFNFIANSACGNVGITALLTKVLCVLSRLDVGSDRIVQVGFTLVGRTEEIGFKFGRWVIDDYWRTYSAYLSARVRLNKCRAEYHCPDLKPDITGLSVMPSQHPKHVRRSSDLRPITSPSIALRPLPSVPRSKMASLAFRDLTVDDAPYCQSHVHLSVLYVLIVNQCMMFSSSEREGMFPPHSYRTQAYQAAQLSVRARI